MTEFGSDRFASPNPPTSETDPGRSAFGKSRLATDVDDCRLAGNESFYPRMSFMLLECQANPMTRRLSKSAGIRYLCAAAVTFFITAPPVSAQQSDRASTNATAQSYAPKSTQSLPVFYDPAMAAKGFPNPLLKARIAGHEALFIVDSGASLNLLAAWFAEVAKIPTSATTDSTVNGSGGKASVPRVAHRLRGQWSDGQRFSLNETMVIAFPPYFKSLHLGGLISPQFLAPVGTAAVLDLKTPSLRFLPFARALSDLQQSKPSPVLLPLKQECHSKAADRVYLAPVTTAGVTDLVVVDTGATKTMFSEESNIAQQIGGGSEPGPRSEGFGGEVNGQRMVRDVQLLRGGRIVALNPSIGQTAAPCDAKGLLGMDALRSCLLILADNEMVFTCD
jgi:Aspartyl protease